MPIVLNMRARILFGFDALRKLWSREVMVERFIWYTGAFMI